MQKYIVKLQSPSLEPQNDFLNLMLCHIDLRKSEKNIKESEIKTFLS